MNDSDIMASIGSARNKGVKVTEEFGPADFSKLVAIFQRLFQRNEVDRPAILDAFQAQAVKDLMRWNVKCVLGNPLSAELHYVTWRK